MEVYEDGDAVKCSIKDEASQDVFNNNLDFINSHVSTRWQHSQQQHTCNTCGKTFPRRSSLTNHEKSVHSTEKLHNCLICNKSFSEAGNLKTHIKTIHHGERPFTCPHCNKSLTNKRSICIHRRCWFGIQVLTYIGINPIDICASTYILYYKL